jgi:carbon-monoxide dehydrogenase large subunit
MGQFGVGQAVRRVEDARLLTGQGRYTDDINLDGQAYLHIVRSEFAHAKVNGIDVEEAKQSPGVLAVYTIADLDAAGLGDIPCQAPIPGKDGQPPKMPGHPILARGKVRHVGDPVAAIVAETPQQAKDAAETVMLDAEMLDHVVDTARAMDDDAPQLHEIAPNNLALDYGRGDPDAVQQAFDRAAHVTRLELVNNRVVANSMEPRGALGTIDDRGRYTLYTSSQGPHGLRDQIAKSILGIDPEQLHVVTPDVGGGFGMKIFLYAEQILVLFAAKQLGRAVKWTGERTEAFQSDDQGRDHVATCELALDAQHRMTAIRLSTVANMGAYLSNAAPFIPTDSLSPMMCGLYRMPAAYTEVKCVFTNTVPVDAYRGAGRPEAAYFVERTVDAAARELGLDPAELRRKNFIQPDEMPWSTPAGSTYDSGEFERVMDRALQLADYAGIDRRKREASARGKLRGLGFATYVEACGSVGSDDARLSLDGDGGATLIVGTMTNGQGHHTAYAQLLADKLGIDPEQVRLRQGDTDELPKGGGTMGSRSLLVGGGATDAAADKVLERARKIAGHMMEVAPADIEFDDGTFTVAGTDKTITLTEVAKAAAEGGGLPDELAGALDETGHYDSPDAATYPNGCHVVELEVDRETAELEILRYIVVDDFGKVVNPMLVSGQIHGGVAQGVGQALLEHTVYESDSGQLVTATYQDYTMPRADNLPEIEIEFVEVPCRTNPFGIKGAGEAGAIGAPPAVINALVDALQPYGVNHIDMPATSEKIWQTLVQGAPKEAAE